MPEFAAAFKEAYESLDPDRVFDLFSDELEVVVGNFDATIRRDDLEEYGREAMGAIEHIDLNVRASVQEGNEVAMFIEFDATYKRDISYAGATFPTEGKTIHGNSSAFFTLDDEGRAKRVVGTKDYLQIMHELGIDRETMEDALHKILGTMTAGKGSANPRPA